MNAHEIFGAIGWLALTFVAWLASRFLPNEEWYLQLPKPDWHPSNSILAPVWSVLYLLMAVAAWLAWKQHGLILAFFPLGLFVFQLILNIAWTRQLFIRHRLDLALINVVVLWVVVLITLVSFWGQDLFAGILLIPYFACVSFAAALNWAIWQKNR